MVIKVCVGSSCHLKGSYDVIEQLKIILNKYDVEDIVELQAGFCLGFCSEGVTVKLEDISASHVDKISEDEIFIHNLNSGNVEDIFVKEIYPLLNL